MSPYITKGRDMGLNYRKTKKIGPVRLTASKGGVSYSVGAGPARVTRRADGRTQATVRAPGTGLSYTHTVPRSGGRRRAAPPTPAPVRHAAPLTPQQKARRRTNAVILSVTAGLLLVLAVLVALG